MILAQKSIFRVLAIVLATVLVACSAGSAPRPPAQGVQYSYDLRPGQCCTLIAHAGGAIDGNPYTNSREALLLSIRNGYHLIEMDFEKTSDGDLFVQHGWKGWASHTGYKGPLPPTTAAVNALKHHFVVTRSGFSIAGTYTVMSLGDLLEILAKHPDVKIVTDAKTDVATIDLIHAVEHTPEFKQFVFQAYSLKGLQEEAALVPQQQLILTVYQMRDWYAPDGFGEKVLSKVEKYPHLFALTIPMYTAHEPILMKRIKDALSVPILVHGSPSFINSRNLHLQLAEWGANGVYVD